MVFAVIFGGLLGPDIFKVFKTEECKIGGSLVLVVLAPFMAKMGISSGANLAKLVSANIPKSDGKPSLFSLYQERCFLTALLFYKKIVRFLST